MAEGNGHGGDIYNRYQCNPCNNKGFVKIGVKFCKECEEYLCIECVENHNSFGRLSGHTMRVCGTFTGDTRDMVCEKDGAIRHFSSTTKDMIIGNIDNTIKDLDERAEVLEKRLEEADDSRLDCKDKIKQLMDKVRQLEQVTIDKVETKHSEIVERITEDKGKIEKMTRELNQKKDNIEQAKGNEEHQNTGINEAIETIANAQKLHLNLNLSSTRVSFAVNKELDSLLEAVDSLGTLHDDNVGSEDAEPHFEYNIKLPTDKEDCDIRSMCLTNCGNLFLADYNNKKLKQVNTQDYTVVRSVDLSGRPVHICSVRDNEFLVCVEEKTFIGSRRKLQLVSTQNQTATTREAVKLDHPCGGIAVAHDNIYIPDTQEMIYIYPNMGKSPKKKIFRDASGHKMFYESRDIVVSKDENKVFVVNGYKGLVVLRTNGKMIHKSELSVNLITALCVGVQGKLYLADDGCGIKEIQISSDNTTSVKKVEHSHLDSIQAMCFDRRNRMLTIATKESDIIHKLFVP